jgi:hypothetical protein
MRSLETPARLTRAPLRLLLAGCVSASLAAPAAAAPTVDGTLDGAYGSALAVQTLETGFGDNMSELDAGYGVISGGKLYLMLTGNLEANFNKLDIFIDSKSGGQSSFASAGNAFSSVMNGLVFDAGFTADYHVVAQRGNNGSNDTFDLDFANLGAATYSSYTNVLGGLTGSGATGTGVNAVAIDVGYDNSNVAGVVAGSAAANQAAAAAVATGLELGIALSDLGSTGDPIHVMVGVNNSGQNYWSNQFLAGLPIPIGGVGQGNLGGDELGNFTGTAAIDMTHFGGDQFFTVVPEPSTLALAGFGMAGLAASGRRRKPGR